MRRVFTLGRADAARTRRAAGLLLALWVLGTIDYLFTVWAQRFTPLQEVNPWASSLLDRHYFASLALAKLLLMGLATGIFWRLRNRPLTQASLWALLVLHVALMVQWSNYTAGALDLSRGIQVQPDGHIATTSYLRPMAPHQMGAPKPDAPLRASVDGPVSRETGPTWQLAAAPFHER
jgi:hypothetical protein